MEPPRATTERPRILLVQADDAAARALSATLVADGRWEVRRVRSALEAIREAGDTDYAAAILDEDLPDAQDYNLLDFLRVESPAIRILMLGDDGDEAHAIYALSHGARDYLVKDQHLRDELPRRVEGMLDEAPTHDLVRTVHPASRYDARPEADADPPEEGLAALLQGLLDEQTGSVSLHDIRGRLLAERHRIETDLEGLGFALAAVHSQLGVLGHHADVKPTNYALLVELEDGLLGVTAIPGTYLVVLRFGPKCGRDAASAKLHHAARVLHRALQGPA